MSNKTVASELDNAIARTERDMDVLRGLTHSEPSIQYPHYQDDDYLYNENPSPPLSEVERKAHFEAAVADYLAENLSLTVDSYTGYYDGDNKSYTIELKLGDRVISRIEFDN